MASPDGMQVMATRLATKFNWHDEHPKIISIHIGAKSTFTVSKDLLCHHSVVYRKKFEDEGSIPDIVKIEGIDAEVFGCVQNFMYRGEVYDHEGGIPVPSFNTLLLVWKTAKDLEINALRAATLVVMADNIDVANGKPDALWLSRAWDIAGEEKDLGNAIVEWSIVLMREDPRNAVNVVKSLSKDLVNEVAVAATLYSPLASIFNPTTEVIDQSSTDNLYVSTPEVPVADAAEDLYILPNTCYQPKRVQGSDRVATLQDENRSRHKRSMSADGSPRASQSTPTSPEAPTLAPESARTRARAPGTPGTPSTKPTHKQEMIFCKELLNNMSGHPQWRKYTKPFLVPIDPRDDAVPDYHIKVQKPMDLSTMHGKIDVGEYVNCYEVEEDIRLIFKCCYTYFSPDDKVYEQCRGFEKFFNRIWADREKEMLLVQRDDERYSYYER